MKSFLFVLILFLPITLFAEKLHTVKWEYPRLALMARVSGTVHLKAKFNQAGKVEDIQAIDGPALLVDSAKQNLSKWTISKTKNEQEVSITYVFVLVPKVHGKKMKYDSKTSTVTVTGAPPPVFLIAN